MSNKKVDDYMIKKAEFEAKFSTCKRLKVGAIIAYKGRSLTTGRNGTPVGSDNCCETDPNVDPKDTTTKENVLHAEQNAILFASRYGIKTEGTTMYCTHSPCKLCAGMLVQAGIRKLVYKEVYRDVSGLELLKLYGVKVVKY